ncbi:MAG: MBL fold metallo-hydrolase [Acidobacteriota bacterium]|nr:MAG: MBL fold metallo-hydrolase [Acidobacteriota bacterium]
MIIDHVQHPGWLVNSWLIAGREDGRGVLVDTGADSAKVLEMVRRHGVQVVAILASHRHYDHVAGNEFLARNLSAPVLAHPLEKPHVPSATQAVEEGHRFEFSKWHAEVIHIPGHAAGMIGLHVPGHAVFTADCLFKETVGGTVGPGHSTFEDLKNSIMAKLLTLPPETKIFPGHGDATSVAHELERNPFVRLWRGLDEAGHRPGRVDGKRVTIEVWARDYDGGHKAQVRFPDESVAIVPGSRVQKVSL